MVALPPVVGEPGRPVGQVRQRPRASLVPAGPALQPRHELGQFGANVDRSRPELCEEPEHALALLVAHQHHDAGRIRAATIRPAPAPPFSSARRASVSES